MPVTSQTLFEMLYRCSFCNKRNKCYHCVDFTDEEIEAREIKKRAQRRTVGKARSRPRPFGSSALVTPGLWIKSERFWILALLCVLSHYYLCGGCHLLITLLSSLRPALVSWFTYNFSYILIN